MNREGSETATTASAAAGAARSDLAVRSPAGDRDRWNRAVERSPGATVLHRHEALSIMAEHSGTRAVPLMGFDGDELVGLFPAFALSKGPVTAVFSPPPHLWVQKLGPAFVDADGLEPHEAERRRHAFLDAAFEWLQAELRPRYVRVLTSDRSDDPRPFAWNGFDVTPEYTYVTDLRPGADELLSRFSSDARRNVREAEGTDYEVVLGDGGDVIDIMEQVIRRYEEQDVPFAVPPEFPRALHDRLPEGSIRPYVIRVGGEFRGGLIAYDDGETVGRWYGGVKPGDDVDLSVNDLLDWHVMRDAIERGRSFYDLIGAGDPRLNRYKAKFAPELRTFFRAERTSLPMEALMGAYRRIGGSGLG